MPRLSADNKQFHNAEICSLLVPNPQITQRELQQRRETDMLDDEYPVVSRGSGRYHTR